jgi:hypothetical protein
VSEYLLSLPSFYACLTHLYSTFVLKATSVAIDQDGSTPMLASFVKKMTVAKVNKELIKEQDDIVHHICTQLSPSSEHDYIVTRPSNLLWDRPSRAKLAASKSVSFAMLYISYSARKSV